MNPNIVLNRKNVISELFKNSRRKTYTTLGITILFIIALTMIAIRPTILKIGEIQNDIKAKTQLQADMESKLSIITQLDQKYRDYEQIIPFLDNSIPHGMESSALTANISEIAKTNQLILDSIQFTPPDQAGSSGKTTDSLILDNNLGLVKVTLNLEGGYDGFKAFVKAIENYPRPMHVSGFTINSAQISSGSKVTVTPGTVNISMDIYTLENMSATTSSANGQ